jgi:cardiolipin synthase
MYKAVPTSSLITYLSRQTYLVKSITSIHQVSYNPGAISSRSEPVQIRNFRSYATKLPSDSQTSDTRTPLVASSSPEVRKASDIANDQPPLQDPPNHELHESPYTIPNALTTARILACPFLGYAIIHSQFGWATGILLVSGFTDWVS